MHRKGSCSEAAGGPWQSPDAESCLGVGVFSLLPTLPSDTKLLLTKNHSEIVIFEKLRISRVISGKRLSYPEIFGGQIPSNYYKK